MAVNSLKGIKRDLKNIIRYLASNDGNYEAVANEEIRHPIIHDQD